MSIFRVALVTGNQASLDSDSDADSDADSEAYTTGVLQFWRLEVQDRGVSSVGTF